MKNGNLLLLLALIVSGSLVHSQTWLDPKDLNPPTGLNYTIQDDNDVNLFWNQPSSGGSTYLHWDSGENSDSFGFWLSAEQFSCAAKWDPDHLTNYDGWTITSIRFYLVNDNPTVQIKLWTGEDATEVYSQDVTDYNVNDWTEIELDEPFVIDAGTELRAGVYLDMPYSGSVMGTDEGPAINGYGDLLHWNGTWNTGMSVGNWNIQIEVTEPSAPVSLHWDSGENNDSFGFFLSAEEFSCASKWDPDHLTNYDGWNITKMRFYVTTSDPDIALKIWTGPDATEVYSQELTSFLVNDWTEVILDVPHQIDASTELFGGIFIDMPFSGAVMGTDDGPVIGGYGDLLYWNGTWNDGWTAGNWNIQLELENPDDKGAKSLLGYNVYRNGEVINDEPAPTTAYIDFNLFNGNYDYYVTALYDDGESDSSNHVIVVIDQPVILEADSLALVDLYNSCGGTSWNNQDNWLTGPLNEWAGITTTDTRVIGVWLSFNNLVGDIPDSFASLDALETLHFENSDIVSIPDNFGNLTALKECWLGWSELTSLPESFGDLAALEEVHLGFLNLGELPESFGNLSSLKWLALGDSQLNSLPDNFGSLTSVTSCFIWGNNLTELPESFGGMESLFYLSAYDNELTSLSDNFGDLDNLSRLFLEENQLTTLPESFGDLESLDTCKVYLNQLSSLPASFGDLDDLSYFNAALNNLSALPASITDLATIEELYFDYNQLESLPEDIDNLSSLLYLGVSTNNMDALPESITECGNLIGLWALHNNISIIPEEIGNLSNLKFLGLDDNVIQEVPESIGDLSALGYIGLSTNNIQSLPEAFGNLEADTVILFANQIPELPATMFDNSFHFLIVDNNALQFGSLEPLIGQATEFTYQDQAKIGEMQTLELYSGDTLNHTIEVSGENNVYSWYKDGELLADQTSNTLSIYNASAEDQGDYHLEVTNTTVGGLTLTSYDVEISYITSVSEEMGNAGISIYPNPVEGNHLNVKVENEDFVLSLEVMDISGTRILVENNVQRQNNLNISSLNAGIYFIIINYTDGHQATSKLIVN